jgi:hypothetical protein
MFRESKSQPAEEDHAQLFEGYGVRLNSGHHFTKCIKSFLVRRKYHSFEMFLDITEQKEVGWYEIR